MAGRAEAQQQHVVGVDHLIRPSTTVRTGIAYTFLPWISAARWMSGDMASSGSVDGNERVRVTTSVNPDARSIAARSDDEYKNDGARRSVSPRKKCEQYNGMPWAARSGAPHSIAGTMWTTWPRSWSIRRASAKKTGCVNGSPSEANTPAKEPLLNGRANAEPTAASGFPLGATEYASISRLMS